MILRILTLLLFLSLPVHAFDGTNWDGKVTLTVPASKVTAFVTDFVFSIDLSQITSDDFWLYVKSDCSDIRATETNETTELPREVVYCDTSAKKGEVHVKLSGSTSPITGRSIVLFFANPDASDYAVTDTYGAQNVWTAYDAVLHFNGNLEDSTSNNVDGTASGFTVGTNTVVSEWGQGMEFDGTDDKVTLNASNLNSTSIRQNNWNATMFLRNDNTGSGPGYYLDFQTPRTTVLENSGSAGSVKYEWGSSLTTGGGFVSGYTAINTQYYSSERRIYINATQRASTGTGGGSSSSWSGALTVAARYAPGATNFMDGIYDELRLRDHDSTDWGVMESENLHDPANFFSVGTVTYTGPVASTNNFFGGFGSIF